jgi:DNA anti-recombination protein RmuC
MKKAVSVVLSLFLIGMFLTVLAGCGADIKAENEKLKTENTSLKSENDKMKLDAQKLKEDVQKAAAEKDTTINNLKAENETLKKQVDDLMAKMPKKKR